MRRASSLHTIDNLVERKISSDKYQSVVIVGDNINSLVPIGNNIDSLLNIYTQVIPNLGELLQVNDNAALVAALYDQFDDIFLGAKDFAPTVDNDGDPLLGGALYFSTADNILYFWTGSAWTALVTIDTVQTLTNKTLDDISNTIGADHVHYKVRNESGDVIPRGTVVTASGTQPGTDYLQIVPVTNATTQVALGITHTELANNGIGLCTNTGVCDDFVNTNDWDEGTILYPDNNGGFTDVQPTSGFYQACAVVTRSHQNQGTLLVEFSEPTQFASTIIAGIVQLVDDLVTADSSKALTAAQGKVLKDIVDPMVTKLETIESGATADLTASEIKTLYESNADTNEFTDHEKSLLSPGETIGTITVTTDIQKKFDRSNSSGIVDGADLTDNINGTINLTAGEAYIRATNDPYSTLYVAAFAATTNLSLVDGAANVVYLDYNAGVPIFATTTDTAAIDITTKVPAYYIYREGNTLHIRDIRGHHVDNSAKQQRFMFYTEREQRASGAILNDAGTLHVSVTAGQFFFQLFPVSSAALDTTGTDTFTRYYRDGVGGYTAQTAQTVVDNAQYDDGTGTLAALTASNYGVQWFYLSVDDTHTELHCMYGRGDHATLAAAEAEEVPGDVPPIIGNFSTLIGRAIVLQGAAELTSAETTFGTVLSGLDVGEYQHLSSAEKIVVQNTSGTNTGDQDAVDVPFNNVASGLTATEVQSAIDEVEGRVDTAEASISNLEAIDNASAQSRYDKRLASLDIIATTFNGTTGSLEIIRYTGDDDATVYYRDELSYDVNGNLTTVKHFYNTADLITQSATTSITYVADSFNTVTYTEV
jgi:hypothetical protein